MKQLCLALVVLSFAACKKEDYAVKPSPFAVGEQVKLVGINPKDSFQPYNCCTPPCTINNEYTISGQIYWYYDITDANGTPLTHVANDQLQKY